MQVLTNIESYFRVRNEEFQNFFEPYNVLSACEDFGVLAEEHIISQNEYPLISLNVESGSIASSHLQDVLRYLSGHGWFVYNPRSIILVKSSVLIKAAISRIRWKYNGLTPQKVAFTYFEQQKEKLNHESI